jgi:hypothetical protein
MATSKDIAKVLGVSAGLVLSCATAVYCIEKGPERVRELTDEPCLRTRLSAGGIMALTMASGGVIGMCFRSLVLAAVKADLY